jgi:hypothetical protein
VFCWEDYMACGGGGSVSSSGFGWIVWVLVIPVEL